MGEAETSHFDYRPRGTMNDDAAVHPPGFLADPTRFLFFTGKGGVGKTSVACAAALAKALVIRHRRDDGSCDHRADTGHFDEPPARLVGPGFVL